MKAKRFLGFAIVASAFVLTLAGLKVTNNSFEVKADSDYTVYKNKDLDLPDYGDQMVYSCTTNGSPTNFKTLSNKSELDLRLKTPISGVNAWIAVGGYGVYISSGATIRYLYLTDNGSAEWGRGVEKGNLVLKTTNGDLLTDVMPNNKIFTDFVDATYKFDLSGSKAVVSFSVVYGGKKYIPYDGTNPCESIIYSHSSNNTDTKFRFASVSGNNTAPFEFGYQDGDTSFTNCGEFTYSGKNSTLIKKSQAESAGVPAGYEGAVLKHTGSTSESITFDFSPAQIKIANDPTIVFRIYSAATVSGNYPVLRAQNKAGGWGIAGSGDYSGGSGYTLKNVCNQWHTFVFNKSLFVNATTWADFADETDSTILGKITLIYRCASGTDVLYIDSVHVYDYKSEITNNGLFNVYESDGNGWPTTTSISFISANFDSSVPAGSTGAVVKFNTLKGNYGGFMLDFTSSNIIRTAVESIVVRACLVGGTNSDQFRTWKNANESDSTIAAGLGIDTWYDFTLTASQMNNMTVNGLLTKCYIGYRVKGSTAPTGYVDSITINYKKFNESANYGLVSIADYKDFTSTTYTSAGGEWILNNVSPLSGNSVLLKFKFSCATGTDFSFKWFACKDLGKSSYYINIGTAGGNGYACVKYGSSNESGTNKQYVSLPFAFDVEHTFQLYSVVNGTNLHVGMLMDDNVILDYTTEYVADDIGRVNALHCYINNVGPATVTSVDVLDEALKLFSNKALKMDSIPTSDIGTGKCISEGYYANAKSYYNNCLTAKQKTAFTGPSYADAFARLSSWAKANGEVFGTDGVFSSSSTITNNIHNLIPSFYVIGTISLVLLVSLIYFLALRKRKRLSK